MPTELQMTVTLQKNMQGMQWWATNLPKVLHRVVRALTLLLSKRTVKRKLLGQVLNRQTGTLIRSVLASPRAELVGSNLARGSIGTNLDYGRAHEEGFKGVVPVRAHDRRRARKGTGKKARRPAGVIHVRAHERRVDIRARHYLRSTLEDATPTGVKLRVQRGLMIAARLGRLPKISELAGEV